MCSVGRCAVFGIPSYHRLEASPKKAEWDPSDEWLRGVVFRCFFRVTRGEAVMKVFINSGGKRERKF